MEANMAGDDASIDAAVAAITKKIAPEDIGLAAPKERRDTRENRTDRDPIEADDYHDLNDLEAIERAEKANQGKEPTTAKGDEEGEEGEEASADDDAYLELPADEEGKAPERIKATEAVEAVKQLRQMNGDIAAATIKAEEEAFAKHDQITKALSNTLQQIEVQGRAAYEMMRLYAPKAPHPEDFYTTEDFYKAKLHFEAYGKHMSEIAVTVQQSLQGQKAMVSQGDVDQMRRENDRTARFIPEFKTDATREAKKAEIAEALKEYGVTKADLDDIVGHREWRIMADLAKLKTAERKAPEVRKHVQSKAVKLVQGRLPERDKANGQFVSEARKAHREHGSEESLARLLLSSGALKGL